MISGIIKVLKLSGMDKMKFYDEKDCNFDLIRTKKVAMLGFGSQGSAHAQNLKDSQVEVIVGLREGSASREKAQQLGFKVCDVVDAVKQCQIIAFMIPDELHFKVFEEIKPFLQSSHTLLFCHGFSVHFKLVQPPKNVGVIMVAPKGQGKGVRSEFLAGRGIPDLIAVAQQNQEGNAKELALAYAGCIGGGKSFIAQTTFKDECEMDLFGEQAVLCGGLKSLMLAGFQTLVEAGYPKELAYFECMHELKLVVDLFYHNGLEALHQNISNTAEYGMITRGDRIITEETRKEMKKILAEIQDGKFTQEFIKEFETGFLSMKKERQKAKDHLAEEVGKELRKKIFNL